MPYGDQTVNEDLPSRTGNSPLRSRWDDLYQYLDGPLAEKIIKQFESTFPKLFGANGVGQELCVQRTNETAISVNMHKISGVGKPATGT